MPHFNSAFVAFDVIQYAVLSVCQRAVLFLMADEGMEYFVEEFHCVCSLINSRWRASTSERA